MAGYIYGNRFKEREDKYVSCTWCGGEIYYDKDVHDDAYEVDDDIICERCFSEYIRDCKNLADYYFESFYEEE